MRIGPVLLRTPCCDRAAGSTDLMRHATLVVRRTCRRCGRRWSIVLRPINAVAVRGAQVTLAEWAEVRPAGEEVE